MKLRKIPEDKPKEGLIIFFSSKTWLGKSIQWFTKSNWNHISITIGTILNSVPMTCEAQERGVVVWPIDFGPNRLVKLLKLPYTQEQIKEAIEFNFDKIGQNYGYGQLLNFGWTSLLKNIGFKKAKNFEGHGVICSEFVFYILKYLNEKFGGMPELNSFDKDTVSPEDLWKLLNKYAKLIAYSNFGEDELFWVK